MQSGKPFIEFSNVTLRIRDKPVFSDTSWQIRENEHWAVLGPNGAGKSVLVRSIWGGTPLRSGRIYFQFDGGREEAHPTTQKNSIGYMSFELHQHLLEREELQQDLRVYAGKHNVTTTAEDIILSAPSEGGAAPGPRRDKMMGIAAELDITHLLGRDMESLSTGEMRKVLIARALVKSPQLLILDEPFDGLDQSFRASFAEYVNRLLAGKTRVILVTHHLEEILPNITHVLLVKNCALYRKGPKETVLTSENMSDLYGCPVVVKNEDGAFSASYGHSGDSRPCPPAVEVSCAKPLAEVPDPLIEFRDVVVQYGDRVILDHVNWKMRRGENWAILGPNGAGKSTIVGLIAGDHLQAYRNDIMLFGEQRGSGESIWQIKERIGIVSSDLQLRYRKNMDSYDIIASGFYDSIGLYRFPTPEQRRAVDRWVELLGIGKLTGLNFHHLSYGQKRLILLARAMVKSPVLLLLDEPCHGLDIPSREKIHEVIDTIGRVQAHVLYVTHHPEDMPRCITHVMRLENGKVVSQGKRT